MRTAVDAAVRFTESILKVDFAYSTLRLSSPNPQGASGVLAGGGVCVRAAPTVPCAQAGVGSGGGSLLSSSSGFALAQYDKWY